MVRILPTKDFSSVRANNFSTGLYLPKEFQVRGSAKICSGSFLGVHLGELIAGLRRAMLPSPRQMM